MKKFVKVYATYEEIESYIKSKLPEEHKDCKVLIKDVADNTADLSVECLCYVVDNSDDNGNADMKNVRRENIFKM